MDFDSQAFLFRVVTIGETAVGKTSLINRLINGKFSEGENPTIGGNFLMHYEEFNGQRVELQIWDTAGQEKYRSLSPIYCRDASAGILVFDLTNKETFLKLESWYRIFADAAGQGAILYIVANKSDMKSEQQVSVEEAEKWASEKGCIFFVTSAKTGEGISELFKSIAEKLVQTKNKDMTSPVGVSISRGNADAKQDGCC